MAEVVLLGIAQDGGRPQPGCSKPCCIGLSPAEHSYPTSLGIIEQNKLHIIDVTRHLGDQLQYLDNRIPSDVWLTHAHFGHVDGLGLFGRETINARGINLHVSQQMIELIELTPHWKIMLDQGVFVVNEIRDSQPKESDEFTMVPLQVPHRNELSDMHAFVLRGPNKSLLYLPDHDTWNETLSMHNAETIRQFLSDLAIDIALIDGTFWSNNELKSRSQDVVPHPPIKQTLEMLGYKQQGDPDIFFFHLNHTNPVYDEWSEEHTQVVEMGWKIGKQGMKFKL
tara:strand:+ start:20984 stop:21829 length:846 start_codon:yes stop_codon:yes gene_type:complete